MSTITGIITLRLTQIQKTCSIKRMQGRSFAKISFRLANPKVGADLVVKTTSGEEVELKREKKGTMGEGGKEEEGK